MNFTSKAFVGMEKNGAKLSFWAPGTFVPDKVTNSYLVTREKQSHQKRMDSIWSPPKRIHRCNTPHVNESIN